jgi:hypothetical protein
MQVQATVDTSIGVGDIIFIYIYYVVHMKSSRIAFVCMIRISAFDRCVGVATIQTSNSPLLFSIQSNPIQSKKNKN